MIVEKYNPNTLSVSAILGLIKSGDIAIPEIQRPFVWKKTQVRDLLDSLYKGYPTGYLIIWKNPNVKLKDGKISSGKKILIDGQQRVTALMTAVAGISVINSNYKKDRIKIAFNPFAALSDDKDSQIFAVQDQSHLKSKKWIPDISEVFKDSFSVYSFIRRYCAENPEMEPETLDKVLTNLRYFVMSKIAADEEHGGNTMRKAIDYFAHLCKEPTFYSFIEENDTDFARTDYMRKIAWLKDDKETVYDPECDDILRVAFMCAYPRAKLADLVSLLSGRDFETRDYKSDIIDDTYKRMEQGVSAVINKNNFTQFMLAIRGAGFVSPKLVNSRMALDFAYALYLRLRKDNSVSVSEVKRIVQKWYVLSVLTGRYSGSPESAFYRDIKMINEIGVVKTLEGMEAAILSDNFWNVKIVQDLAQTSTINPTYLVYLAAQVSENDMSLLSNNVTVKDLIEISGAGDVHHIFPKEYLKANGYSKNMYNQIANYAFLDTQVNKSIGKDAPCVYFQKAKNQCDSGVVTCGSITDINLLHQNLSVNCIPEDVINMDYTNYMEFLSKRRLLMAEKIRKYYYGL